MRKATIKRFDGGTDSIDTYDIHDFPYDKLNTKALSCKHKKKPKFLVYTYATFDIETSTVADDDKPFGFMYHWQMDVGGYVVTGRYWIEWVEFMNKLVDLFECNEDKNLVVYIHNEAFEFQFMRDIINQYMGGYKVFASQKRKPIYVTTGNGIQFRCSYKLTNMSLAKACDNELGVVHCKAEGDLDYKKMRTADTPINDTEFGYNVSDVVCQYELIERRMINEHDDLESIPMTSTGYVRRDCRNSCRKDKNYRKEFLKQKMTPEVYQLLSEAGRGGNTHANRHMSGRIWHDVDSFDATSDYPAQMFIRKFPITKFTPYGEIESIEEFQDLLKDNACLFRIIFEGMEVKNNVAMPYISISKATAHSKDLTRDNGRLLSTINGTDWKNDRGFIALTLTDIDYEIITRQYTWDNISISDMHIATYGYLPDALLSQVMEYFKAKCELKGQIAECEEEIENCTDKKERLKLNDKLANLNYLYAKSKNRLNGIFGMCYTNPIHDEIFITEDGDWELKTPDIAETLEKHYKSRNSFLVYAWGIWITAWARLHLEDLFDTLGQENVIYGDTDSGKAVNVNEKLLEPLNKRIKDMADLRGAYCDYKGVRYYMGVFEHENKKPILKFKTLGAKKYVYEDEKGLHVTISGVNKKLGSKELGCIENFDVGFIFKEAGGITMHYNDINGLYHETIDGCTMLTGSNIGVVDSTYTLGLTDEYAELIGYNIYYDIDKQLL